MKVTVNDVLQLLKNNIEVPKNTVDTLKFGSENAVVNGIAIAFMPTYRVIQQAIDLGANLLITHECLFYNHWDEKPYGENQVHEEKEKLLKESGLAVFRFHDYWHRYQPDGITKGLVQALEWEPYISDELPTATIVQLPMTTVFDIAQYVKGKLGMDYLRCVGDLSMKCQRVGLLVGYRGGGSTAIPLMEKYDLDLVLFGEGPEWETPEYVRDAISQGRNKAVIALGHAESEEPGMRYLAKLVQGKFPTIPTNFISMQPLFQVI
ncbi:Nif3-like dinuclear metal center hexameric protein [Caldibacillus lycopersici]|uniref:GTP cyclohydrolase 1 type 2 homolog n=1 Tax=Perspicuibacillus lycopersici TaxID=1325689 RepID=A0AAE3IUY2_9BACI|nr:Nif3-like dinuclear metal center hexameric protein [Perspicuibacillus lycopersici]MCU9615110.1 Nif3-like dinuclear metal center hexameric protein [Perspicuibacillus lycopersici]